MYITIYVTFLLVCNKPNHCIHNFVLTITMIVHCISVPVLQFLYSLFYSLGYQLLKVNAQMCVKFPEIL